MPTMPPLKDLRTAVEGNTATPEMWESALAEYEALAARPSPEALLALQEAHQAARSELASLHGIVEMSQQDLANLQGQIATLTGAHDQTQAAHAEAIARLKQALAAAHQVPEPLLAGATVAELDASLESARSIVAQIAEQVRTQQAAQVPNGAPPRSGPDLDAMSPLEKIRYGLSRANGR